MKVEVKNQIPVGGYTATFDGATLTEHPEYGQGLAWSWTISVGRYRGQQVFRTTKPQATAKNSAGKFLQALTGKPLDQAAACDLDDYRGKEYTVLIEQGESGTSRVASFAALHAETEEGHDEPF